MQLRSAGHHAEFDKQNRAAAEGSDANWTSAEDASDLILVSKISHGPFERIY